MTKNLSFMILLLQVKKNFKEEEGVLCSKNINCLLDNRLLQHTIELEKKVKLFEKDGNANNGE